MSTDPFQAIMSSLDAPMYVVTVADEDQRAGCLVGFASHCSIHPARFVAWISTLNRTYRLAVSAEVLAVHALRLGDEDLARHFGALTGDDVDKFDTVTWAPGPSGVPILERCDWFAGRVVDRISNGGDHVGFVLAPFAGDQRRTATPGLGYQATRDIDAGHPG